VRLRVVFEVDYADRIAIAALTGTESVASRDSVRAWIQSTVRATLDDIRAEHEASLEPSDVDEKET
jgi:hypothetical protein